MDDHPGTQHQLRANTALNADNQSAGCSTAVNEWSLGTHTGAAPPLRLNNDGGSAHYSVDPFYLPPVTGHTSEQEAHSADAHPPDSGDSTPEPQQLPQQSGLQSVWAKLGDKLRAPPVVERELLWQKDMLEDNVVFQSQFRDQVLQLQ